MNSVFTYLLLATCLILASYACSCNFLNQKQVWDRADIVTKMNIVEKKDNGILLEYKANYLQIYKPQNMSHILIPVSVWTEQSIAACGAIDLQVGNDYLIAATYNKKHEMEINSCTGIPADDQNVSKPVGALQWLIKHTVHYDKHFHYS